MSEFRPLPHLPPKPSLALPNCLHWAGIVFAALAMLGGIAMLFAGGGFFHVFLALAAIALNLGLVLAAAAWRSRLLRRWAEQPMIAE